MNLVKKLNESKKIYDVKVDFSTNGFYLGLSTGNNFVSKGIKIYSQYIEKIPKPYLCSHAFTVFDGTVYESNALGNQERHITKYIKNGHEFWLFKCRRFISESNYNNALSYAEGALGRVYDYPGFMSFFFKFIPQLKYGDFCSEYATTVTNKLEVPFLKMKPEDISPSRILQYLFHTNNWQLCTHYRDGKKL